MPVFNPLRNLSALRARLNQPAGLTVICYCAAWCDTCKEYEGRFEGLAAQWPEHVFIWIDIEDSPELLGDEDVENFPTVAIQGDAANLFFGALQPHADHLERLIRHAGGSMPDMAGGPPLLRTLLAAP